MNLFGGKLQGGKRGVEGKSAGKRAAAGAGGGFEGLPKEFR
jgi:hypothetical protein